MKGNCDIEIEVSEMMLNNAIQKVISASIKRMNVEEKVNAEVTRRIGKSVNKSIENGTFVCAVAKNVAKVIDVTSIIALINIDELKAMVADRIAKKMVDKMNL